MSKSKNATYIAERLRRTKIRKAKRRVKRNEKKQRQKKLNGCCPCCGRGSDDYWDW